MFTKERHIQVKKDIEVARRLAASMARSKDIPKGTEIKIFTGLQNPLERMLTYAINGEREIVSLVLRRGVKY